jgi:cyclopropane-fatty-acyl-phospholipid synthase
MKRWRWNGNHYARTCNAWLKRMDSQEPAIAEVLEKVYGDNKEQWRQRWRIFFMSCAELFAFNGGNEWYVSHYLFKKNNK